MASSRRVRFGSYAIHVTEATSLDDLEKELLFYGREFIQDNLEWQQEQRVEDPQALGVSETSRRRRRHHVQCVLNMQAEINEMGVQDATGLKALASALSKADVKRARDSATCGATEAFQVYAQSTEWMKGITAKDYSRATRVVSVRRKNNSQVGMRSNRAALRRVGTV